MNLFSRLLAPALIGLLGLGAVSATPTPAVAPVAAQSATTNGARLSPTQPIPPAELEAFVDGVMRQAMVSDHVAGAAVSVVQNGAVILKKGYGYAHLSPAQAVDPDTTVFRIASISKTFTWILLLQQVEAGHMRLDAPINLYLPERLRIADQGYSQAITVNSLMNHTPGFEDRALGQLFERDPGRVRPLNVYLQEEKPARVREPGVLVSYSNYGVGLAGAAVAEVTGKPFEALAEMQILRPLGMNQTTFREPHGMRAGLPAAMPQEIAQNLAEGYRWTPNGFQPQAFEFVGQVAPAAAASTTAADMTRYMLMFLGGGAYGEARIYGPTAALAFATPQPAPPGVPALRHGLMPFPLPGGITGVGHVGDTLFFHSAMVLVPQYNLGIFVTTNSDRGLAVAGKLPADIVGRFYAAPAAPFPARSEELRSVRGLFEGDYVSVRRARHGLEGLVERVSGASHVSVTTEGHLLIRGIGASRLYTPAGPDRKSVV